MAEKSERERFLAAAAKLRRDTAKHAKGGDREDTLKLFRAADRLEDRVRFLEGDHAEPFELVKGLRQQIRLADEAAYVARVEGRNAELKRLNQKIREGQPQGYEKELAISRGGAYRREPQDQIVTQIENFVGKLLG